MLLEIDDVDKTILQMLQDNSRIAFRKIAEKVKVSEATVFTRVKKLFQKGIIKKYSVLLSPKLLGINLTAFILINADPKKLPNILKTLSVMDDIYEVYDITGTYYALAKIRTKNREKLVKIIDDIGLIEGITKTETAIVLKNIKEENRLKIR